MSKPKKKPVRVRLLRDWNRQRPGTILELGGITELLVRRGIAEIVTDEPETAMTQPDEKATRTRKKRPRRAPSGRAE